MSIQKMWHSLFSRLAGFFSTWPVAHPLKRGALLYWAALLTISAAGVHFVGALKHPPQPVLLTLLLLSSAIVQVSIAVYAMIIPGRRLLIIASIVEGIVLLLWLLARTIGLLVELSSGLAIWRPETLGLQDFFLPFTEGITALFFLILALRTWTIESRVWRVIVGLLPALFLISCLLIWGLVFALNAYVAELVFATFFFAAGIPWSLLYLFLPGVGLIALVLLLRTLLPYYRARMHRRDWQTGLILLPVLLIASLLTWEGCNTVAIRGWFLEKAIISAPTGQTTTLAYCHSDSNPLAIDLAEPGKEATRSAPVVLYIHGGAGFQNSRDLATDYEGVYFTQIRDELLNHGFVVASIDYRLIPLASGQEIVKEAKCAVRFLRAHAKELRIDPQHIGVYGDSEGGYISAMLGTAGPQAGFDTGEYINQASNVQAVADLWGFTNLTNFSGSPAWVHPFGEGEPTAQQLANSPVTYVASGDPPFLIIHGTDDGLIALHHSQELATRLHAANIPTQFVMVQHGGHGFAVSLPGKIQQPNANMLVHIISNFFMRTLANSDGLR